MQSDLSRRGFLKTSLAAATVPSALSSALAAASSTRPSDTIESTPIIDAHIHLFDPTRPQGVPWPAKTQTALYQPALPPRYRTMAFPLGIRGAIEVECSPWPEDNQWVLDVAETDPLMVGMIGNLEPGKPEFPQQLERLRRNPLFLGIRYGNLWGRNLTAALDQPAFIQHLKLLADAGLVLDTANPNPRLLADIVRLTDLVPALRVVIDHLPGMPRPDTADARASVDASLKEFAGRTQTYVKISQVLRGNANGPASRELTAHRDRLDEISHVFGPDRVIFGSDWPNSDQDATYEEVLAIVRAYFATKPREEAEKYFWRNSVAAYRWISRDPSQPKP